MSSAIAWLVSGQARYVTGIAAVDAGFTAVAAAAARAADLQETSSRTADSRR